MTSAEIRLVTDRSHWMTVCFGEVVRAVKENVDPESSGLTRYIAGEHMGSDDLRIRRWGEIGDGYLGPAFHRKFKAGQVLYGSRRTYLRKVAVPHFDGICANTTFVLEPKDDKLVLELLPFIMQTKSFSRHAVEQSKGSVNPYVNWKDLASYEFALPPKLDQQRIAKMLWSIEHAMEGMISSSTAAQVLAEVIFSEALLKTTGGSRQPTPYGSVPSEWEYGQTQYFLVDGPINGFSPPASSLGRGYPTLSLSAIRGGRVIPDGNIKLADVGQDVLEKYRLRPDDLLLVRGNGNRDLVGRCAIVETVPDNCFYPDLLIRVTFDPARVRPEFALLQWNSKRFHERLLAAAKSSNGIWKINGKDVKRHPIVIPPLNVQDTLLDRVGTAVQVSRRSDNNRESLRLLKNEILGRLAAERSDHV